MLNRLLGLFFKRKEEPIIEDDKWSLQVTTPIEKTSSLEAALKGRIRVPLKGNGSYSFDIVGEASYQDVLGSLAGKKTREGKELRCIAVVLHEPINPYDLNAIAVVIGGKTVGYFSKSDAKDYANQLTTNGGANQQVGAVIVGGFKSKTKEGHFGVRLDITRHS